MRMTMPGGVVAVAALLAGCTVPGSHAYATTGPLRPGHRTCPAADVVAVVARVNEIRGRLGLHRVGDDTYLARYASTRSAAMSAARTLSHHGWESGLRKAGLTDDALGENVAYNYDTAADVMAAWMRSPGHRANILQPVFRRIGVGCVIDPHGHRWWTQDFAG
jgi:uncharacterized protein YkwD